MWKNSHSKAKAKQNFLAHTTINLINNKIKVLKQLRILKKYTVYTLLPNHYQYLKLSDKHMSKEQLESALL